jgi:hypothetical protein
MRRTSEPQQEIELVAEDPAPYPRIAERDYDAQCIGHKLERVRMYGGAWKLRLTFRIMEIDPVVEVAKWFHLGLGSKVKIGRKSQYWAAWTIANGGKPPGRGKTMTARIFEGSIFRIRVRDVRKRWDHNKQGAERLHTDSEIYSTVTEIIERCTGPE